MTTGLRSALYTLLVPCLALSAQEYQVGASYTRTSPSYEWKLSNGTSGTGPRPGLAVQGQSLTAPALFGDLTAPIYTLKGIALTGNIGLHWALGDDVGGIDLGVGAGKLIEDGYVNLSYMIMNQLNGEILGGDWGIGTEGVSATARRGPIRVDLIHTSKKDGNGVGGLGYILRTNARTALAVRYRVIGARIDQWSDEFDRRDGSYDHSHLTRFSVFAAWGQWDSAR